MKFNRILIFLFLVAGADTRPSYADGVGKPAPTPFPNVHKNHVRKASGEYLACFRRIAWHYDFAGAAELARQTGRPMFVVFCRAGTITDPASGKPKCAT
ncbi:MAG: hypothetical protein M3463_09325 [Verrucomicrobiota bacterium]|nr:hypothetical protein [Verrucomicrobiota bacterium]